MIETLNVFTKLEEWILRMVCIAEGVSNKEVLPKLSLPNLKVLSVEESEYFKLTVSSKLEQLYCDTFSSEFDLKHPEHLRYIEPGAGL